MFSRDEREQIRTALVRAAQADSNVTGAAHLGSAAADRLDDWSDIDLALCVSHDAAVDGVIATWTARMYRDHEAIAHCDVRRGETLYRVFLLRNTLQVDLSFWPADRFTATGPKFKLIFGNANEPRLSVGDNAASKVGDMMWFGPLKRFQKAFFHTPLVNVFVLGSELYHDYYRWPMKDRKTFEEWQSGTKWGQLFERYGKGDGVSPKPKVSASGALAAP